MTDEPAAASGAGPGLYVHVPFCSAICPYCDFAVLVGSGEERGSYVDLVLEEAASWRERDDRPGAPLPFDTLYLGGGTPSALPPEELARLVAGLGERLPLAPGFWLGMEVNPEDVDSAAVLQWRELDVDFLSLGVQAFDDLSLRRLGRRHDRARALHSLADALDAGFPVVSVDLIYALPGEPAAEQARWESTLATLGEHPPPHLSCYELTFHEGTPFGSALARGRLSEHSEESRGDLFLFTHRRLAELGFEGYEVSNFARQPASRSRHNQKYWRHVPYLGLGPSAHSFDGRRRFWNVRELGAYRHAVEEGRSPIADSEELDRTALVLESLLLGLRSREGVDLDEIERRHGVELRSSHGPEIDRLVEAGLLAVDGSRLRPTLSGLAVAERLAVELASDA